MVAAGRPRFSITGRRADGGRVVEAFSALVDAAVGAEVRQGRDRLKALSQRVGEGRAEPLGDPGPCAPAIWGGPGTPRRRQRARVPGCCHRPSANWPPGSGRSWGGALASVPLKRRNQGSSSLAPAWPNRVPTGPPRGARNRLARASREFKMPLWTPPCHPFRGPGKPVHGSTQLEGSNPSRFAFRTTSPGG